MVKQRAYAQEGHGMPHASTYESWLAAAAMAGLYQPFMRRSRWCSR